MPVRFPPPAGKLCPPRDGRVALDSSLCYALLLPAPRPDPAYQAGLPPLWSRPGLQSKSVTIPTLQLSVGHLLSLPHVGGESRSGVCSNKEGTLGTHETQRPPQALPAGLLMGEGKVVVPVCTAPCGPVLSVMTTAHSSPAVFSSGGQGQRQGQLRAAGGWGPTAQCLALLSGPGCYQPTTWSLTHLVVVGRSHSCSCLLPKGTCPSLTLCGVPCFP